MPRLQPGDWAIILDNKGRRYLLRLEEGAHFGHHAGGVSHEQIMAAGYGGSVRTSKETIFHVLRPSLEDYVLLMKRGAAVTYPKDAAAMLMLLDLAPGERVLEAGSGSGGLSLFLSRAVGPQGRVVSYERRPAFKARAEANVRAWGAENVDFHLGNLEEAKLAPESFDAVALDLMEPWLVLENVVPALKTGRKLVCYLPNITQVVRLIEEINERRLPLLKLRILEVVHRDWDVRPPIAHPHFRQIGHTAFLAEFSKLSPRLRGQAVNEEEREGQSGGRDGENPVVTEAGGHQPAE
ncbi:tRNA (adenine-N1)-methyltransferase [Oceanithermus sp.]